MTAVIAFRNPTPAELLARYLERVLLQSEEWRRPLDFGWSPDPERQDEARTRMAALLEEAGSRIAGLSIPHLFASAERGVKADASSLDDTTRLQRERSTTVVLRDDGERVRVEIQLDLGKGATASCSLPSDLRPMLEWLAESRGPFTFAEVCTRFSEWDRSAVAVAIASFLKARALVEIPFEAW